MSGKVVTEEEPEKLSVAQAQDEWWSSKIDTLSVKEQTAQVVHRLRYLTLKETAATHPLTLWLVADLDTAEGRNLVIEALGNMVRNKLFFVIFFLFHLNDFTLM